MKRRQLFTLISVILMGVVFSCKIETDPLDSITDQNSVFLKSARISIDERLKNEPLLKGYQIEPLWNKAVLYGKTIEVPFSINGKYYRPLLNDDRNNIGRARLLITEKGNSYKMVIIHYIPSKNFKGNILDIDSKNFREKKFDGVISLKVLGKERLNVLYISNGKIYKKINANPIVSNKSARLECYSVYTESSVETVWDGHEYVYVFRDGSWREYCIDVNDDDTGGGDGSEYSCDLFPELCNGNEGNNDYTAIPDIKNEVTNPCISNVVNNFLQNPNAINQIIQGVFSCNDDVNLIFANGNIGSDEGITEVINANPAKTILVIKSTINNNQANYSQEYIASTVIHEVFHAYMTYTGSPYGNNTTQHLAMGHLYVDLMRNYLQTMYSINSTDATVLALGGLENYFWFPLLLNAKNISPDQYWQTKQAYKDNTLGNYCQ